MRCVEFETRLNELLDGRVSPAVDAALAAHARRCVACAEVLAGHEALLEGVTNMPAVAMTAAARGALAPRVVAALTAQSRAAESFEGGSFTAVPIAALSLDSACATAATSAAPSSEAATCEPFRAERALDVAVGRPAFVAANRAAALGMAGLILAAAAAILIVVLPWFQSDGSPDAPEASAPLLVETQAQPSVETPPTSIARAKDDLEPIAWVGYRMADGLKPVTDSMASALRELRKRPLFRSDDANGRSSFLVPRDGHELAA